MRSLSLASKIHLAGTLDALRRRRGSQRLLGSLRSPQFSWLAIAEPLG
jgi:hypothetical protein